MNIGITGSKGFIAEHIKNALKNKNGVRLFFCALPECDLLDPKSAENFTRNKDVIIHAAAINRGSDADIIAGGVVASHNLMSAIKKNKQKTKLIFLSSIQAETETVYGQSKRLCEIMLESFSKENNLPVSIFRLTNVFGEGGKPFYNSVIATFSFQVARGEKLTINNPKKKFNFVYVKDIVDSVVKEVFEKRRKQFYFKRVNSLNDISIGELAKLIQQFEIKRPELRTKFQKDLYKTYLSYNTNE